MKTSLCCCGSLWQLYNPLGTSFKTFFFLLQQQGLSRFTLPFKGTKTRNTIKLGKSSTYGIEDDLMNWVFLSHTRSLDNKDHDQYFYTWTVTFTSYCKLTFVSIQFDYSILQKDLMANIKGESKTVLSDIG